MFGHELVAMIFRIVQETFFYPLFTDKKRHTMYFNEEFTTLISALIFLYHNNFIVEEMLDSFDYILKYATNTRREI